MNTSSLQIKLFASVLKTEGIVSLDALSQKLQCSITSILRRVYNIQGLFLSEDALFVSEDQE